MVKLRPCSALFPLLSLMLIAHRRRAGQWWAVVAGEARGAPEALIFLISAAGPCGEVRCESGRVTVYAHSRAALRAGGVALRKRS